MSTQFLIAALSVLLMTLVGEALAKSDLRATWVWDTNTLLSPKNQSDLISFAKKKNLTDLYLEFSNVLHAKPSELTRFIQKITQANLKIVPTLGDPSWATPSGRSEMEPLLQATLNFVAGLSSNQKPKYVQLDIEPYVRENWKTPNELKDYLKTLRLAKALCQKSGILLSVTMPFWFDQVRGPENGKPLSESVIDIADQVVIMDYNNKTPNLISFVESEMRYAQSKKKSVILAFETLCGLSPSTVSFCNDGLGKLAQSVQKVSEHYLGFRSFSGVAIHDYGSFKKMVEAAECRK